MVVPAKEPSPQTATHKDSARAKSDTRVSPATAVPSVTMITQGASLATATRRAH